MKTYSRHLVAGIMTLTSIQAATILDQNFDTTGDFGSSSLGRYNGQTGDAFADDFNSTANTALGNATGTNRFLDPAATGGVDNSRYLPAGDVRSRSTADVTTLTTFSSYFQAVNAIDPPFGSGHGMGWSLSSPDNVAAPATGSDDRFLVGFRYQGDEGSELSAYLAYGGDIGNVGNSGNSPGGERMTTSFADRFFMTEGNWYELSFDMAFDGTDTFNIDNIVVRDWGSDGVTGGSALSITYDPAWAGGSGSVTVSSGIGANFSSTNTDAYALFTGTGSTRGFGGYDNLSVTAIPEPSTLLLLGTALAGLVLRRRAGLGK